MLNNIYINKLFKEGKKISNKNFTIFFLSNDLKIYKNYSITVGKIYKNKPQRNKIKRQCKEILRKIKLNEKYIFNIHIKKNFLSNSFNDNFNSLVDIFNKIDNT